MSALAFTGNTAKAGAPGKDASGADQVARTKDKPDFEKLVRQERPSTRSASRADTHASRRDERRPASAQEEQAGTERTERTAARRASKPQEDGADPLLATAWLMELPAAHDLDSIVVANPLLTDAAATLLPAQAPANSAFVADAAGSAGADPLLPQILAGAAASTSAAPADTAPADAAANNAPATQAEGGKPTLQNLLSFATHLATGNVAAAVPEAIALGKDAVDALRSDDTDSTAPTGNTLAGLGNVGTPLGLARTATVNAMEAPGADLHGGRFDEEIGDSVRWMADQKIGHAHIRISPNELGTVEVRLRLDGDRVHADFTSAQADVRQALENSLPRLRDMLGQHGFQLAHADVGQQHQPSSQATGSGRHEGDAATGAGGSGDADLPRPVRMTALGLLDAYA
ncbi:flagellar hook-length control protein FliK [Pseudoxanthomonas putridarboris]